MAHIKTKIWFSCLSILPFTSILTFITTLIVCSQVRNSIRPRNTFLQISQLGIGHAYFYFVFGFALLVLQILTVLIGRIQFLIQSQTIINRNQIYAIHADAFIASLLLLIMAIVSVENYPRIHVMSAIGMFGFISSYCVRHTIAVFKLYRRQSEAPRHANVIFLVWFLVCTALIVTFASVWIFTGMSIPQYIAASTPLLYCLGYVPQFLGQAAMIEHSLVLPPSVHDSDDIFL